MPDQNFSTCRICIPPSRVRSSSMRRISSSVRRIENCVATTLIVLDLQIGRLVAGSLTGAAQQDPPLNRFFRHSAALLLV